LDREGSRKIVLGSGRSVEGKEELRRGGKPAKMQMIWNGGARNDGGDNKERAHEEETESGMGRTVGDLSR
jgi:hypothetical protein